MLSGILAPLRDPLKGFSGFEGFRGFRRLQLWASGLQGFRVRVYALAFRALGVWVWEFPKIRGTSFWGPYQGPLFSETPVYRLGLQWLKV